MPRTSPGGRWAVLAREAAVLKQMQSSTDEHEEVLTRRHEEQSRWSKIARRTIESTRRNDDATKRCKGLQKEAVEGERKHLLNLQRARDLMQSVANTVDNAQSIDAAMFSENLTRLVKLQQQLVDRLEGCETIGSVGGNLADFFDRADVKHQVVNAVVDMSASLAKAKIAVEQATTTHGLRFSTVHSDGDGLAEGSLIVDNTNEVIGCCGRTSTKRDAAGQRLKYDLERLMHLPTKKIMDRTLLFQDALKCTPEAHAEYRPLLSALKVTKDMAEAVNATTGRITQAREAHHNKVRLLTLEVFGELPMEELFAPSRRFVKELYVEMAPMDASQLQKLGASFAEGLGDGGSASLVPAVAPASADKSRRRRRNRLQGLRKALYGKRSKQWGQGRRAYKWYIFSDALMIAEIVPPRLISSLRPRLFSSSDDAARVATGVHDRCEFRALYGLKDVNVSELPIPMRDGDLDESINAPRGVLRYMGFSFHLWPSERGENISSTLAQVDRVKKELVASLEARESGLLSVQEEDDSSKIQWRASVSKSMKRWGTAKNLMLDTASASAGESSLGAMKDNAPSPALTPTVSFASVKPRLPSIADDSGRRGEAHAPSVHEQLLIEEIRQLEVAYANMTMVVKAATRHAAAAQAMAKKAASAPALGVSPADSPTPPLTRAMSVADTPMPRAPRAAGLRPYETPNGETTPDETPTQGQLDSTADAKAVTPPPPPPPPPVDPPGGIPVPGSASREARPSFVRSASEKLINFVYSKWAPEADGPADADAVPAVADAADSAEAMAMERLERLRDASNTAPPTSIDGKEKAEQQQQQEEEEEEPEGHEAEEEKESSARRRRSSVKELVTLFSSPSAPSAADGDGDGAAQDPPASLGDGTRSDLKLPSAESWISSRTSAGDHDAGGSDHDEQATEEGGDTSASPAAALDPPLPPPPPPAPPLMRGTSSRSFIRSPETITKLEAIRKAPSTTLPASAIEVVPPPAASSAVPPPGLTKGSSRSFVRHPDTLAKLEEKRQSVVPNGAPAGSDPPQRRTSEAMESARKWLSAHEEVDDDDVD